ncbi:LuxR C-terminal-related transcriptional regulator [Citrobacter sedlakii]
MLGVFSWRSQRYIRIKTGGLTSQEKRVLNVFWVLRSQKAVSGYLCCSQKTINQHKPGTMKKLRLKNRTDFLRFIISL